MNSEPFVVAPKNYAHPLNIVGERITVLASGEATGSYEIFLQQGPEGTGPRPMSDVEPSFDQKMATGRNGSILLKNSNGGCSQSTPG